MQPVNGYIQVEVVEDLGLLKTLVDEFSPQKVKVIAISLPWKEYSDLCEVNKEIKVGSVLLAERIYKIPQGNNETVFIRNSQIISILENSNETLAGT